MRVKVIGLVAALGISMNLGVFAHASDWPQFRGPTGQGISVDKGVPLTWAADKNIIWKVDLPGPGTSSPIVFGERIFLTCYSGYNGKVGNVTNLKRYLVSLERKTGKHLWTKDIPSKLPEVAMSRDPHGFATSTPIAEKDRVYAFYGKSGVFAFDHDGKQLWHADVGSRSHEWGSAAPLAMYGDLLYVNASVESDSLVALNKNTGKEVWRASGIKDSWCMPLILDVQGKKEVVIAMMGKLHAFDPATGEKLWTCNTNIGWYMVPSMVSHDGVVYAIGGRSGVVGLAVKGGGRGDVTKSHRLWTITKGSNVSSPIYHDGHLYWVNDASNVAYCADAKTGNILYEERMPGASGVYGSPVLAEGRIYYTDRTGKTFVVAAQPQFKLLGQNVMGRRIATDSSPAISEGRILLRADQVLYCIGEK
jgi:outer membrane protein assembly factor BamB